MSAQKQKRILDRGVDVLVATPGRLWDIIQEDDALSSDIKTQLKFLVLDEADRMIETGHFMELENILRLTVRAQRSVRPGVVICHLTVEIAKTTLKEITILRMRTQPSRETTYRRLYFQLH